MTLANIVVGASSPPRSTSAPHRTTTPPPSGSGRSVSPPPSPASARSSTASASSSSLLQQRRARAERAPRLPRLRSAHAHPTAGFNAADFAGAFGAGRKTDFADLGASVKLVQSHIGSAQAQTVALDLGARRALGPVEVGTALRNLGPSMKFDSETDDLPLRLAVGAACKLAGGHALTAEVTNAPRVGGTDIGFGGEYQAIKGVFLRAGYTTQSAIAGGLGFDAARELPCQSRGGLAAAGRVVSYAP